LKTSIIIKINSNKKERFHPSLFKSIPIIIFISNKLFSFHLSQPFSQSYRSILPTSLTHVIPLRLQRLLTLRTWCGYRYEMVWEWLTTHYFSWNNRITHNWYYKNVFNAFHNFKRKSKWKWPPIQTLNEYFSQQMKLHIHLKN